MNDPLKKFVQQHHEAFDQLEVPTGVLQRLQTQLKPERIPAPAQESTHHHRVLRRYRRAAWLVAASLLIGVVCTYLFFDEGWKQRHEQSQVVYQPVEQVPLIAESPITPQVEDPVATPVEQPPQQQAHDIVVHREPAPAPLAVRLADSTSASTRLAAILEIEQSERMNERVVAMLSETMNRDGNTNVRLAALDVLSRHLDDPQVANLMATALTSQDDPLVQLGIVRIAAQIDHIGIEEALFSVARNPYTFEAVKDEAYAVLLYQEKL